jgi:hypothetical protein
MRSHEARRKAVGLDVTLNFFDGTMCMSLVPIELRSIKIQNQNLEKTKIKIWKNQNREK